MIAGIVAFLRSCLRLVRAVEALLVDLLAAVAPWLAPIVPAYLTYQHTGLYLGLPEWVAIATALVVETLGLSTITTVFQLWDWNDQAGARVQRAPVWVSVFTAGFYLAVVLSVNVLLDPGEPVQKLAKGLLSTLSVVAGITLAIRSQHARRLEDRQTEREERRQARLDARHVERLPESSESSERKNFPESFRKFPQVSDWRRLGEGDIEVISTMTDQQVMVEYGVSDRTVRTWRHNIDERKFRSNGKGEPVRQGE